MSFSDFPELHSEDVLFSVIQQVCEMHLCCYWHWYVFLFTAEYTTIFGLFTSEWTFGCFQSRGVMNKAALNLSVQVFTRRAGPGGGEQATEGAKI